MGGEVEEHKEMRGVVVSEVGESVVNVERGRGIVGELGMKEE